MTEKAALVAMLQHASISFTDYGNTIEIGSGTGPRTYFEFGDAGTLRNHWISD